MDAPERGDGAALEQAFQAEGMTGRVDARGRLAVFRSGSTFVIDSRTRRRLVALARQHGFTNLAVELEPSDENLPRD